MLVSTCAIYKINFLSINEKLEKFRLDNVALLGRENSDNLMPLIIECLGFAGRKLAYPDTRICGERKE